MTFNTYTLAELVITDGTDAVDLLYHFKLAGWQPATATYKDGGVWQDSPIADGRRLVQRYYGNLVDQFQLVVKSGRIDSAISALNRLRQLLEKAADYWATDWQDDRVWMEARGIGETNRRYSLIVAGIAPSDPNPYASPFAGPFGNAGLIELGIEHLPWLAVKPTSWTETPIGVRMYYGGAFRVGNVDAAGALEEVTNGECFVTNADANSGEPGASSGTYIERVFSDSFAGPLYPELVNTQPSVVTPLLDGVVAVGQAIYFGCLQPFSNIILNLSQAVSGITIATWEYWNGAAWAALPGIYDSTTGLTVTGVKQVSWTYPSNWAAVATGGDADLRYYVRVRVTAAPGPQVYPEQTNRIIYTNSWPYFEVQEDQVAGTLAALARYLTHRNSTATAYRIDRLLIGLRSVSRGADFSHIITLTDDNNYSRAEASATAGSFGNVVAPSGRRYIFDPATILTDTDSVAITFQNPEQWLGRYRVLLRSTQLNGAAGYFTAEVKVLRAGAFSSTTGAVYMNNATDDFAITGIGTLDTKGNASVSEIADFNIYIVLTASADAIAANAILYLYDLILLPVDEFPVDAKIDPTQGAVMDNYALDSLQGRWQSRFYANQEVTDFSTQIGAIGQAISAGPAILQKQTLQRLYFVMIRTVSSRPTAPPYTMMTVKIQHQARYHGMRGNE